MQDGVMFEQNKSFLLLTLHNFKLAQKSALQSEVLDSLGPSSSVGKLSNRILHMFSLYGRINMKLSFLSWKTALFQVQRDITPKRQKNPHLG